MENKEMERGERKGKRVNRSWILLAFVLSGYTAITLVLFSRGLIYNSHTASQGLLQFTFCLPLLFVNLYFSYLITWIGAKAYRTN